MFIMGQKNKIQCLNMRCPWHKVDYDGVCTAEFVQIVNRREDGESCFLPTCKTYLNWREKHEKAAP